jgi:hypothetical protein
MLVLSCNPNNKKCKLPQQIIGTGEIVSNALVRDITTTWEMRHQEYVIHSDTENVYHLQVSFDNSITFQEIDFFRYTLLGRYTSGGCHVNFDRNISRDVARKQLFYEIKVQQCGTCETHNESMNWVLVPKISDDYKVLFNVEKCRNGKKEK